MLPRPTVFACRNLLLLLLASLIASASGAKVIREPAAKFVGIDGASHNLGELRGHPAVINFWATWCGPCHEEMPRLQKLADAYASKGVTFIAISLDDVVSQPKIPASLSESGLHIPVWTGATDATLKQLELGILVPATLILDSEGDVIGKIEGEAREKDIQVRLDWLMNNRQGKQPKIMQRND